jgi:hypothetical protein
VKSDDEQQGEFATQIYSQMIKAEQEKEKLNTEPLNASDPL